MAIDPSIFKAYDIRGLYGEQIDGDTALAIGRAFAHVLSRMSSKPTAELRVGLGRDMRLTAPELAARYREGLLMEGVDVLDAGQVGTEMLYFLVGSRELDGGLMCTASHNPKAYTGAKLVRDGAIALSGDAGIQDIRREIEQGLDDGSALPLGTLQEVDVYEEFQAAALELIDAEAISPLKVVVDGGNGMAGPMVGPLLERLGLDLIETYWTPDGSFPDHEPNPLLPENRKFIIEKVKETGADLGIAWDGDADRCFFIDDTGEFVDGDFLTALLAKSLLAKRSDPTHPAAILYDVRASWAVPDTVKRAGGIPYINRVGHAFFKTRMRKEGSLFGGEVSGHYYFRDFYCADSGTIPALLILEQLSRQGKRLSELLRPYRERYFISGEINTEVTDQQAKMQEIAERYADARQSRLDGVSIDYEDWHFNVRPSNTEPLLRLCLESLRSREHMESKRDEVLELIPLARPDRVVTGADAEQMLARAAERGVHCLPVPTPFAVGRVNCYLVEDEPLTLLDAGPNSATSLTALESALATHGRRVEDLQRIVVTHQHIDHIGLVEIVAKRSGAEVCALDRLAPWLADYKREMETGDSFSAGIMLRNGIPEDVVHALRAVSASFRGWGAAAHVTRPLAEGELLEFASRGWRVLHRPGHSPSDTVFWDEASGELFGGDHLIKRISSNPLITMALPPPGGRDEDRPVERPRALMAYLDSLRLTREMQLDVVLAGHGEPIEGHRALIDERFRMHERRADKLHGLIAERPRNAYELAQEMWGNVAVTQAFLTLSEVLGHVDLLIDEGRVGEREVDGVVRFEAT